MCAEAPNPWDTIRLKKYSKTFLSPFKKKDNHTQSKINWQ